MYRNKKGDLSLSINAIVVLILAITMLGLGLGFVRNMFGQGEKSINTIFDTTKLSNPATAGDPVKVPSTLTGKKSEVLRIELSIYNTGSTSVTDVTPNIKDSGCLKAGDTTGNTNFKLTAVGATIQPSSAVGYTALFQIPDSVAVNDVWLCPIQFKSGDTIIREAQMTVQIIS